MYQGLNRGVKQGFTGDEQKCEAGRQRCTVINRDAAAVPWSCSIQWSARAGLQIHVRNSCRGSLVASHGLIDANIMFARG